MKEFVEKLIEHFKGEEYCADWIAVSDVKTIIVQLAEEYNSSKSSGLAEQIADDLSKVLKEARDMGCKEVRTFHHIPLENVEIVINALKAYNQDSTKKNQGWILCSERLPKTNGVYQITRELKIGEDIYRISSSAYFDGQDTWHNDNRVNHGREYLKDIIAWQPLPDPYKPEEKQKWSNEELDRIMDKILDNQDLDKVKQEPKTRIEHIRSMSVEELADAIMERSEISTAIDFCQNFCGEYENIPESECKKCLIKYLNSPVEQKKTIPTEYFKERFNRVL